MATFSSLLLANPTGYVVGWPCNLQDVWCEGLLWSQVERVRGRYTDTVHPDRALGPAIIVVITRLLAYVRGEPEEENHCCAASSKKKALKNRNEYSDIVYAVSSSKR